MKGEQTLEIPRDKFVVDVDEAFLFNLIEKAIQKAKGTGNISKVLIQKHGLKRYTQRSLADNLRKWQRKKNRIYLDCYLNVGNYCHVNEEKLFSKIKSIKLSGGKIPLISSYPLKLNRAWGFVSECIKVEGNLSKVKKRVILENTDMSLIQKFIKEAKKIGISKFRQDLRIKVMVPADVQLSNVEIINLKTNEKRRAYERVLKLKKGDKKELIFIEPNVKFKEHFDYLIKFKSGEFKVQVDVPSFGKIRSTSTLKTNLPYQKVTPSFIIVVGNTTFHYILNRNFQIATGKKSREIFIPSIIKHSSKAILKDVINAVLAAESTVWAKGRKIVIASLSEQYLRDFQELLLRFNITSSVNTKLNSLLICGSRNFEKINENFDFILENKKEAFGFILKNTASHSPKGLSMTLYLKNLGELGRADWRTVTHRAGRVGGSSRIYLKELLKREYVETVKNKRPKEYIITNWGKEHLEQNMTYWL